MGKFIITETQSLYLRRRLHLIDGLVKKVLLDVSPSEYNYHDYVEEIAWSVWDNMSESERGDTVSEEFFNYIWNNYWEEIETYYIKHC
jgi:hypothetical protein